MDSLTGQTLLVTLTIHLIAQCCFAGPTAVIDQLFDADQSKAVPDSPEKTALIFPYKNQYVLFDGRLGHGVLGSSSKQPRMTMLVNWWAEKPQVQSYTDTWSMEPSKLTLWPMYCAIICMLALLLSSELHCTYSTEQYHTVT